MTIATTAVIAAGRDAQLHFAITDPDGNPVDLFAPLPAAVEAGG